MGLANWLTILRILLIPIFVSLLVYRKPAPALAVFGAAALTDLLDGWIARRQGSQSRLGAFLDPVADKLLLTASFVTLTYLRVLPFWIAAVVLSRDVILVVGTVLVYMLGARVHPRPTWAGKAATFFQILTVLTGLGARYLHLPVVPRFMLWLAAAFTVISGLQYIVQGMRRSLYVKDADVRLSLLHGNYITLTDLDEAAFERIIEQHLSPLYVSVHATDPTLRHVLLGRPRVSAPILPRLERLAKAGIRM